MMCSLLKKVVFYPLMASALNHLHV